MFNLICCTCNVDDEVKCCLFVYRMIRQLKKGEGESFKNTLTAIKMV